MCLNEMACRKSTTETEFSSKDTGSYDSRKPSCVFSRLGWMSPSDAKEVKASALGFEDRAAADGSDFDRGH